MFDLVYFHCKLPPLMASFPEYGWQTKDFPGVGDLTITEDGRLVRHDKDINYDGYFDFVNDRPEDDDLTEFRAYFVDGKLEKIEILTGNLGVLI